MTAMKQVLAGVLTEIEKHETDYALRETLVYEALSLASRMGYKCGVRTDKTETNPWPVVVILLPDVGEVSWHCPPYDASTYTGYDTAEKYKRTRAYAAKYGPQTEQTPV